MLFQTNSSNSIEYFICSTNKDTVPELTKVRYENIRSTALADKVLEVFHAQKRHRFPDTYWGKLCKIAFAWSLAYQHNNNLSLEDEYGVYVRKFDDGMYHIINYDFGELKPYRALDSGWLHLPNFELLKTFFNIFI